MASTAETFSPSSMRFELQFIEGSSNNKRGSSRRPFASASASLSESVLRKSSSAPSGFSAPPPRHPKVDTKPASDVLAGAMARAASQGTIHPLDTLKVQMQTGTGHKQAVSKIGRLMPPAGGSGSLPRIASLYRGVVGAASGAGIAIGTYFAFYGAATNLLATHTTMSKGSVAFVAGGIAAAGGSIVKVPLAVCIRSVQAGVYPNVFKAASAITTAAGPRGLFTGYLPTLLEDVPDMAFKFAAYESLRSLHRNMVNRQANAQEDFAMGAVSGAFAAAATTPLDVIKTQMMCSAASRPTMVSAARKVMAQGGARQLFRGVGPRALSNGINSAVFFCFFEALRASFARHKQAATARKAALALADEPAPHMRPLVRSVRYEQRDHISGLAPAPASLALSFQPLKIGARLPKGSMRRA